MSIESLKSEVSKSQDFSGNCGVTGKLETMDNSLFRWYRLRECNQPTLSCSYWNNNLCGAVRSDNPTMPEAVVCGKSLRLDNPSTIE